MSHVMEYYEMVWPNQDQHISCFVAKTETPGIYSYIIEVDGVQIIQGGGSKEYLSGFLPKLKTFDNRKAKSL